MATNESGSYGREVLQKTLILWDRKRLDIFGDNVKRRENGGMRQVILDDYRNGGHPIMHGDCAAMQYDRRLDREGVFHGFRAAVA